MAMNYANDPGLSKYICQNKYLQAYINNYVKVFRNYCDIGYAITITGLGNFVSKTDLELYRLLETLQSYGFSIKFVDDVDTVETLQITYQNLKNGEINQLDCNIGNLLSIIELSSKTNIPTIGIIIIKIVSRLIFQVKILYKAIVLDLDDTIWKGTLAEEGVNSIERNMHSKDGIPFLAFMNFVKVLAEELGIYVAICSKNSQDAVKSAIALLDQTVFPLKGHIDCVVANYNDKSSNIESIAKQLSILPNAIVFIDDNPIVRDEVRTHLPEVFVPEWTDHFELTTLLIVCCAFDRFELSLKARNRRRQFEIIRQEREIHSLPKLFVKINADPNHKEASKLYAKSNQFRFAPKQSYDTGDVSVFFEIFRDNGENLGVCSSITYTFKGQDLIVKNWAISCRYFEIGLEEFILQYIASLSINKRILFKFQKTMSNQKAVELLAKYNDVFIQTDCDEYMEFVKSTDIQERIYKNTNLRIIE